MNNDKIEAIVLCSGGMDSTTLMYYLWSKIDLSIAIPNSMYVPGSLME